MIEREQTGGTVAVAEMDARNESRHDGRGALGHNGTGSCIDAILKRSPGNAV